MEILIVGGLIVAGVLFAFWLIARKTASTETTVETDCETAVDIDFLTGEPLQAGSVVIAIPTAHGVVKLRVNERTAAVYNNEGLVPFRHTLQEYQHVHAGNRVYASGVDGDSIGVIEAYLLYEMLFDGYDSFDMGFEAHQGCWQEDLGPGWMPAVVDDGAVYDAPVDDVSVESELSEESKAVKDGFEQYPDVGFGPSYDARVEDTERYNDVVGSDDDFSGGDDFGSDDCD